MPMLGHRGTVKIGATPTSVGEITAYEVSIDSDVIEDTACLDTVKTYQRGLPAWSGSMTFWWDYDGTTEHDTLLDEMIDATADNQHSAQFEFNYGTTSNGYLSGTILMSNMTISNPGVGGIVSCSCRFTGVSLPSWTASVSS